MTDGAISAFTLTITENASGGGTDVFTWGLGDLSFSSFTLTDGNITDLSLLTDVQAGFYTPDQQFADNYSFFAPDDAVTFDFDAGPITVGALTVTPDSVPEPASLALLGAGMVGVVVARKTGSGSFLQKEPKNFFC